MVQKYLFVTNLCPDSTMWKSLLLMCLSRYTHTLSLHHVQVYPKREKNFETNLVRKKEKILKWETVKLVLKSIENISFFCDFFNFLKKKNKNRKKDIAGAIAVSI